MKLWLISQTENRGYDVFDSAIVAAETEELARAVHPQDSWGTGSNHWESGFSTWASRPDNVRATLIGEATDDTKQGVICASFNAG